MADSRETLKNLLSKIVELIEAEGDLWTVSAKLQDAAELADELAEGEDGDE
jgi:hypothetical protein